MKLLIVFSALCLVTVTSNQEATIDENTIPKFLERCSETIYATSFSKNSTLYITSCSLKDLIGNIRECGDGTVETEIYACWLQPMDLKTEVTVYQIKVKAHNYSILQRTVDLRKREPDVVIEKNCENAVVYPKYCTLKYA